MEDKDDVITLDMLAIQQSIESGEIIVPRGLSRDERHYYVRKQLFLEAEARKEKFMKEFFGESVEITPGPLFEVRK